MISWFIKYDNLIRELRKNVGKTKPILCENMANEDAKEEQQFVKLHYELEIDYQHTFDKKEIILQCIAELMKISNSDL